MDVEAPNSYDSASPVARPEVDIRVVIFSVLEGRLVAAFDGNEPANSLPRGWPSREESLDSGAKRIVHKHLDKSNVYLEQLYTFNSSENGVWSVVISYMALTAWTQQSELAGSGHWRHVDGDMIQSITDRQVLDYAVVRLRAKLGYTTIAFHLLPAQFTLRELQGIYEAILDTSLDKRNFRRRVLATGMLDKTPQKRRDGKHRPASLYQFHAPHDHERFLTPSWVEDSA